MDFKVDGEGKEGLIYVKEAPKTSWASIYMCFGVAIGSSFGNNTGIGISLGMLIGLAIGTCFKKEGDDTDEDEQ